MQPLLLSSKLLSHSFYTFTFAPQVNLLQSGFSSQKTALSWTQTYKLLTMRQSFQLLQSLHYIILLLFKSQIDRRAKISCYIHDFRQASLKPRNCKPSAEVWSLQLMPLHQDFITKQKITKLSNFCWWANRALDRKGFEPTTNQLVDMPKAINSIIWCDNYKEIGKI